MPKSHTESRIRQARRSKPARGKNRAYLPGTPNCEAKILITLATFFRARGWARAAAALVVAIIGCHVAATSGFAAESGLLHLRCVNMVGGANWSVVVDLDKGEVDSRPATISQSSIKWRDDKGGLYELERATGKLQLRGASTTGGYFLHYECRPE